MSQSKGRVTQILNLIGTITTRFCKSRFIHILVQIEEIKMLGKPYYLARIFPDSITFLFLLLLLALHKGISKLIISILETFFDKIIIISKKGDV
jgi:hypothetical protein